MSQLVGLENGAEQIKKLDDSLKGTSFLNDQDFGKGVYDSYNKKYQILVLKEILILIMIEH
jgi:hypothetical protein